MPNSNVSGTNSMNNYANTVQGSQPMSHKPSIVHPASGTIIGHSNSQRSIGSSSNLSSSSHNSHSISFNNSHPTSVNNLQQNMHYQSQTISPPSASTMNAQYNSPILQRSSSSVSASKGQPTSVSHKITPMKIFQQQQQQTTGLSPQSSSTPFASHSSK